MCEISLNWSINMCFSFSYVSRDVQEPKPWNDKMKSENVQSVWYWEHLVAHIIPRYTMSKCPFFDNWHIWLVFISLQFGIQLHIYIIIIIMQCSGCIFVTAAPNIIAFLHFWGHPSRLLIGNWQTLPYNACTVGKSRIYNYFSNHSNIW